MPRRSLHFQTGHCYHLYNRGNNRQKIFFERENYVYFLRLLSYRLLTADLDLLAYCLMPNHYHLLVKCNRSYPPLPLNQKSRVPGISVGGGVTLVWTKRTKHET